MYTVSSVHNRETEICIITEKLTLEKPYKNIVKTSCGTFEVTDDPFSGHHTSKDLYKSLLVNSTYELTTGGYEIPSNNVFKNILTAKLLDNL